MEEQEESGLSRRALLLTAAAMGLAEALPVVAGEAKAVEDVWDYMADVVCIGSGAAAGAAAVTARAAGASVIVVEKMPLPGGTSAKSGGVAWIPNHKYMREQGLRDERDDCLRYMARFAYPMSYVAEHERFGLSEDRYALLAAFYDNGSRMVEHMEDIGALRFAPFRMWAANADAPDYADHLDEDRANRYRALEVAAGDYSGGGGFSGGRSMVYQLEQWLQGHDVPILLDHRVLRIIKEAGRAVGVEVLHNGKAVKIAAKKAVIFGTGGYSQNAELISLHQPADYGSCSAVCATGDFLPIAQEAGLKMGDLSTSWRTPVVLEQALVNRAVPLGVYFTPGDSMIHVNKYGRRVVNEKRNYNDRTRAHFVYDPVNIEYPNMFMFMVFDERTLSRYAGAYPLSVDRRESPWLIEGRGVGSLVSAIKQRLQRWHDRLGAYELSGDFEANLTASIERFNQYAKNGVDEDFQRGEYAYDREWMKLFSQANPDSKFPPNPYPNNTMHPIDMSGSLYAVILAPGSLDTSGGPAINAGAQLLDAGGHAVPGLYGAGNCVASPTGPTYMGAGGTIGPAMTFGYIAARHALGLAV